LGYASVCGLLLGHFRENRGHRRARLEATRETLSDEDLNQIQRSSDMARFVTSESVRIARLMGQVVACTFDMIRFFYPSGKGIAVDPQSSSYAPY
jgi:hypothetical protein